MEWGRAAGTRHALCKRGYGRLCLLCIALVFTIAVNAAPTRSASLLILLSQSTPFHHEISTTIEHALHGQDLATTILDLPAITTRVSPGADTVPSPDLIITVGTAASRYALSHWPEIPVLMTLIPSQGFAKLTTTMKRRIDDGSLSAVFLDQPITRQILLIEALSPQPTRIGTVFGPTSKRQRPTLERLMRERGLDLIERSGPGRDLAQTFRDLARQSDLILALPDPAIMTPTHAKWLLYIAYLYQTPVVAYSRSFVDAGALAAVFSSPGDIARQAIAIVQNFFSHPPQQRRLPPPGFPDDFTIAINRQVAHSLELDIPATSMLSRKIRTSEAGMTHPAGETP